MSVLKILFPSTFLLLMGCGLSAVHKIGYDVAKKTFSDSKKDSFTSTKSASCPNKLGGDYGVGRAPSACSLDAELTVTLSTKYHHVTFDDRPSRDAEELRYAEEMYQFIAENAGAYFKRREEEVTEKSITEWVDFVLSVAHQESIWSHFRYGEDGIFRFLRGDNLHGYGMMQIDDRSHKEFIKSKKVYDLQKHLTYSLDMLYTAYQKVNKDPCDIEHTSQDKFRSVYSMYNGGFGAKCRWTKNSRWRQNDINFWEKYSQQKYVEFLTEDVFDQQQEKLIALVSTE